jgi:hypothetical protein
MCELAMVHRIEIYLAMLQVMLLKQSLWLKAVRDLRPDGVVGADGLVGGVPELKGLLRSRNVEASGEVAHGLAGGVAQVIPADRFHDHLDRIRGMLGHQIGEGVAAAVAAPALALLVAGAS